MFHLESLRKRSTGRSNYWLAWLFLLALIIIAFFSSCVTKNRCERKFPPATSDSTITVYKDSIVHVTDTVYLDAEYIHIYDSIPCPELEYHKTVTKNHLTASVHISKGQLKVDCKSDSLQKIIHRLEHRLTVETFRKKVEVHTVQLWRVHWYDKWARWISIILLPLFAFYIGIKIRSLKWMWKDGDKH